MNFLYFLLLFTILYKIKSGNEDYETITLKYDSNEYYIPIKIGKNKNTEYFIFSNLLPINVFPSSKCTICDSYHINESDVNSYSFIKNNVIVPYYYLNFTGDLYESSFTLGSQSNTMYFLAFDNISYIENYKGKGRFSLSFLNYCFNTTKKIFSLSFDHDKCQLHLGGYSLDIINNETKLNNFTINKTNYNNSNEYLDTWYINSSLSINGKKMKDNYKFTFDISSNFFYIPKDFFFENADKFFSEKAKCQVQPEGYFICECDRNYDKYFGDFVFYNSNNNYIEVKYTDYISIDEQGNGNICYVLIKINYENDLFIAGKYIMNNYYIIFDIENNQLRTLHTNNGNTYYEQKNVVIFLFVLCMGGIAFLCCYCIYKNFCSNNIDEENINDDLLQENEEEGGEGENRQGNEDGNSNEQPNAENNIFEMNNHNDENKNDNLIEENRNNNINDNKGIEKKEENIADDIDKIEFHDEIENNFINIRNDMNNINNENNVENSDENI